MEYKSNISRVNLVREKTDYKKVKITCSTDCEKYARQFYHEDIDIYESVFLILLNRANNTVGYAKISQGGVAGTVIDVKIICKYALDTLCSSVILVHNHPSGNTKASSQDLTITSKTKKALALIDVSLLDHIIITEEAYTSMADDGLI